MPWIAQGRATPAGRPANVAAREVAYFVHSHGKAIAAHSAIDLIRRGAILDEVFAREFVVGKNPVADEPVADSRTHGNLPEPTGEPHARRYDIPRGLIRNDHFRELHHVGRREEMQADHVPGSRHPGGEHIDIKEGRVRRKDASWSAHTVQRLEDFQLGGHVLEDGLHDHVAIRERSVVLGAMQIFQRLRQSDSVQPLACVHAFQQIPDARQGALQCGRIALNYCHRQPGCQQTHANSHTHRAATDDSDPLHGPGLDA